MDDDDLRRGRPTTHKVYGEAIAVLAGDALLTESFAVLAQMKPCSRYQTQHYITELAQAGDSRRLIGGQVLDLEGEGQKLTKRDLIRIHEAKTAALLTTSLRLDNELSSVETANVAGLLLVLGWDNIFFSEPSYFVFEPFSNSPRRLLFHRKHWFNTLTKMDKVLVVCHIFYT